MKSLFLITFLAFSISSLASKECGKTNFGLPLSVGGEYSVRGQWPWLTPLFKYKDGKFLCASSIISKRHLLTASHCIRNKRETLSIQPSEIYGLLGKFDLSDLSESGVVQAAIDSIKIHSDWKPTEDTFDADIAILKVKEEIVFTNYIQQVCLPNSFADVYDVQGSVAGYGISEESGDDHEMIPKYVMIESVTQEVCLFSHETFSKISSMRMFCAGEVGKNPCRGDSGGGFYVKKGPRYYINGIVSASLSRECHENQFVLFTSVSKFIDWIKQEVPSDDVEEWKLTPLKCNFENNEADKRYECFSPFKLESTTSNVKISSVDGEFPDGKTYTDVDTVSIKQSSVTFVPEMSTVVQKLPNFKKLYIVLSGLKFIERSKLAKLTQLTVLNFFGNDIEFFESDVFDDLINLEVLAFVKNKIKTLPTKLVWNLANLKEIWSYDNPIEAIPRQFFKNNLAMEKAWMGYSNISRIRFNFKTLPNLNILDLRSNVCINEQGCSQCRLSIADVQNKVDDQC